MAKARSVTSGIKTATLLGGTPITAEDLEGVGIELGSLSRLGIKPDELLSAAPEELVPKLLVSGTDDSDTVMALLDCLPADRWREIHDTRWFRELQMHKDVLARTENTLSHIPSQRYAVHMADSTGDFSPDREALLHRSVREGRHVRSQLANGNGDKCVGCGSKIPRYRRWVACTDLCVNCQELVNKGFDPDQVRQMIETGNNHAQIQRLLDRRQSPPAIFSLLCPNVG
ncbi:MAG: hypothetical protein ABIB97_02595 [Patescibacteria group bacterium]